MAMLETVERLKELEGLGEKALTVSSAEEFNRILEGAYVLGWRRRSESTNPFFDPQSVRYCRELPRPERRGDAVKGAYQRGSDDFTYYELFCTTDD